MAIIALSGKKQSGKSTVGKIINIILNSPHLNNEGVMNFLRKDTISTNNWQIKMFAEKLKQITCILIGCTMDQLEDETFKNTPLGEEWNSKWQNWIWESELTSIQKFEGKTLQDALDSGKCEEVQSMNPEKGRMFRYTNLDRIMTPRLLLQLLGTECGREIIHPNIWVNSLMSDYIKTVRRFNAIRRIDKYFVPEGHGEHSGKEVQCSEFEYDTYPNWVITDMRFPNELKAVEDKNGITIRVERKWFKSELPDGGILTVQRGMLTGHEDELLGKEHPSETALDDAEFKYTINNDGSLEELIDKVREILIKEKFINNGK